jgi:hypothetical protein
MDLKTFVAETLTQIVQGVALAKQQIAATGTNAQVNPIWREQSSEKTHGSPKPVDFDVAVTVMDEGTETAGNKIGGKAGLLSVVTASISAEDRSEARESRRNESTSRIKFTVLLAQPSDVNISRPISIPQSASYY